MWSADEDVKGMLSKYVKIKDGSLTVLDDRGLREKMWEIVWNAVFNTDESMRTFARWVIWEAAGALGIVPSSIHDLYMARARGEYSGVTVPAINIRGMTFDVASCVFRTLIRCNTNMCIFEIARSEIDYTMQRPSEYATSILAAAIREGYRGPVFIQGDHFQANLKRWKEDPAGEMASLRALIEEAVNAGFYNIDIDASTLVDMSVADALKQQENNYTVTAELLHHIREIEPSGVTISVGGEIGEVGGRNSTIEDLIAYLSGLDKLRERYGIDSGLSKVSVQTGTSHGGVVLPDGTIAKVKIDFDVLSKLGAECRRRGIGGVVQHGASTLPDEAFHHFPKHETLEVHLATGFQNIIMDSKHLPHEFKQRIYRWLNQTCQRERKPDDTDEQFYYKTRKKGFGPFKKEWWGLSDDIKRPIMEELEGVFEKMFAELGIRDKKELTEKFINTTFHHKRPAISLGSLLE